MHEKNLRFKIIVLCALFVAGLFAFVLFTREPSADGRTLSKWLELGARDWVSSHDTVEVTNAIRKIGVKAVPILLNKLRARDPDWLQQPGNNWVGKIIPDGWLNASEGHTEARYAFCILGTQAVVALPELSKMLHDTNLDTCPAFALGYLGSASLPVLKEALTDRDVVIRRRAANGITTTRDVARGAMSEILVARGDTNPTVPAILLNRLVSLLPEDELLSVARAYLEDTRPGVQQSALTALSHVETNRAAVVPLILPFLTSDNANTKWRADKTLFVLDRATAIAHGVDTNILNTRAPLR
jgi:hypothetical protein